MSRIKDENYYQISGWMLNKLNLKGTALNVYAIVYGFSQDGESEFKGGRQFLCDFTGATKPTIDKALDDLVEQGLIIRKTEIINNIRFNKYMADLDAIKNFTTGKETLPPSKEFLPGGGKETLPNNKYLDNKIDNKNIYTPKKKYGEYQHVLLTDMEIDKLNKEYGKESTLRAINYLDEAIEMKGYRYKSHYLAMKKWVFEAAEKQKQKDIKEIDELFDNLTELDLEDLLKQCKSIEQ